MGILYLMRREEAQPDTMTRNRAHPPNQPQARDLPSRVHLTHTRIDTANQRSQFTHIECWSFPCAKQATRHGKWLAVEARYFLIPYSQVAAR
jgi:hypothetical protein